MEALAKHVEELVATADAAARQKLLVTLRDLAYSLEDPSDTLNRIGYLHLQTAVVRIGFDLELFQFMAKTETAVSIEKIVEVTGADPLFISIAAIPNTDAALSYGANETGRCMIYLASIGVVKETGQDLYTANNVTRNLSKKMTEAGICHCFETIGTEYQELPRFMKETGYRNPNDPMHTVFQTAWKANVHQFAWFKDHPDKLKFFNDYMALRRGPDVSWLSVYPVEKEAKDWDPTVPVYVNMGGGVGHQCAQFKERFPDVPGLVILQDLPHSIDKALPTPGVENMVHDFFEPQPVKMAKFYFTRGVLHNHPDDKVRLILRNIMSAMGKESVILLDEWVLPQTGVSSYAASMDLTMMAAFASMERTEAQWRTLFDSVGLRLVKSYTYNPLSYETVMDVRM